MPTLVKLLVTTDDANPVADNIVVPLILYVCPFPMLEPPVTSKFPVTVV